ncbi:hypothetical protein BCVP_CDS0209 [Bacillus phage BC-VP]|nr:hypothetical protein BCVP_CDS0209 [Bacillus phage BC-VP]
MGGCVYRCNSFSPICYLFLYYMLIPYILYRYICSLPILSYCVYISIRFKLDN